MSRWVIFAPDGLTAEGAANLRRQWDEWETDPEGRAAMLVGEGLRLVDTETGREYPSPESVELESAPFVLPWRALALIALAAALGTAFAELAAAVISAVLP